MKPGNGKRTPLILGHFPLDRILKAYDLRIDRNHQLCITSRYKALPCNAVVRGSASRQTWRQSLLELLNGQSRSKEAGQDV
ncbi:MAG: hypothetical protein DSM106950_29470 [Stigonema ocellatum SAG 48.90 = DSM 106950]|nr:hypothetical protein [Stigonema ocellatum SAG 48.90 = DSM 106950]